MLQVGLTGGIGSGKSTVARRLVELGARLIDADALAREVVEPATPGLAGIVAAFGDTVLTADGALDRPALASVVFADPAARERLNGIVHPLVRQRSGELLAAAPPDAVVVQDIPLLVEGGMAERFPLVIVVDADPEVRVRRLVEHRGMPESDARARMAAQAGEAERRAVADVWLDNGGTPEETAAAVDEVWSRRIVPFEENLRLRRPVPSGSPELVGPDPRWPAEAARLAARVAAAAGELGRGVAHIGSTAVPGLVAEDVIDLQLGVASMADADAARDALQDAGFPWREEDGSQRVHSAADPARRVSLYVREVGSPGWRTALLVRDWLRADDTVRAEYREAERAATVRHGDDPDVRNHTEYRTSWFDAASPRAEAWAASSRWSPSLH